MVSDAMKGLMSAFHKFGLTAGRRRSCAKKPRRTTGTVFCVTLIVLSSVCTFSSTIVHGQTFLMVGSEAPDFKFRKIDGRLSTLDSTLKKRDGVMLWFVELSVQEKENAGSMQRIYTEFQKRNVEILLVFPNPAPKKSTLKKTAKEFGLGFSLVEDIGNQAHSLYFPNLPTSPREGTNTFIIDKKGIIRSLGRFTSDVEKIVRSELEKALSTPYEPPDPSKLAVCPVCRMRIRITERTPKTEYEGKTYYFMSERHKEIFLENPSRFIGR